MVYFCTFLLLLYSQFTGEGLEQGSQKDKILVASPLDFFFCEFQSFISLTAIVRVEDLTRLKALYSPGAMRHLFYFFFFLNFTLLLSLSTFFRAGYLKFLPFEQLVVLLVCIWHQGSSKDFWVKVGKKQMIGYFVKGLVVLYYRL